MEPILYKTLREMYLHSITTFHDRPCFSIYNGENLTFADFSERVARLSEIFRQSGLRPGNKIALFSSNMPNWNVAYFAAVTSGFVIVPLLPDFSPTEVNTMIAHSEAKALVVSDRLFGKINEKTLASLNAVIRATDLQLIRNNPDEPLESLDDPAIEPDSLAAIIYTSGTTSSPKGVMLSHKNLCSQVMMVQSIQTVTPDDTFLSVLPLSHTYECSLGMLLPFANGAHVYYIDRLPTASVLIPIMQEIRPTMMLTVPIIMEKIFKHKILPQFTASRFRKFLYSLPLVRRKLHRMAGKQLYRTFGGNLHFFGIGGAKLDPRVERFLNEGKFPYAIGYGLTETAPLIAGSNPTKVRLQSTGPLMKGMQMRIENPNPQTGEGEIVVKGDNVMVGYYKNPKATADAFTSDGWFRTKDLVMVDREGYIYIKGRLSNMILGASGENIYPEEIEHVINGHSMVLESLVKEDRGKLIALVQFNREALEKRYDDMKESLEQRIEQLKQELLQYVNQRVNKFSRISTVEEQSSEFEKTATKKIKRFLYTRKGRK